jgi:5-hydroxyisourate hydrolase-like protein (transthyretin family)
LVNVVVTVEAEAGKGVPSVDVAMKYNYTTRSNNAISEIVSMRTNLTGMAAIQNLLTNTTYKVEATRYGMLFNSTTLAVEFLPSSPLTLDLTLPTYTLNVHAIDSQNKPADEVQITVYEWTSGVTTPLQTYITGSNGDASFSLPFGRYRLIVLKGDAFLNESIVNLIENPVAFTFYLDTANVQVTVSAFDYFGQPIANAEVRIERKVNQEYAPVDSKRTGGGGSTAFALSVGGDSRISVYVAGRLVAARTQFLGAGSNQVTFNIGEYVSIFGYSIEAGLFTLAALILVLTVVFLFLARRNLMKALGKRLKR